MHAPSPQLLAIQLPFKSTWHAGTQREISEGKQQIILSLFRNTSCTQKYILQSPANGAPLQKTRCASSPVGAGTPQGSDEVTLLKNKTSRSFQGLNMGILSLQSICANEQKEQEIPPPRLQKPGFY